MSDSATVRSIKCSFFQCLKGVPEETFHSQVIQLLQEQGAEFYQAAPFPPPVDPDPFARIKPGGRLNASIAMSHALLRTNQPSPAVQAGFLGYYGNTAVRNSFRVDCSGWRDDVDNFQANIQQLAESRLGFLKWLIPVVSPEFALADDVWTSHMTDSQLQKAHTRHLYWATYFGPHFVETHGRDFLLNTPAWRTEEWGEGVLIVVTAAFMDFVTQEPKETLKYLRQVFKGMRANRFAIHSAF